MSDMNNPHSHPAASHHTAPPPRLALLAIFLVVVILVVLGVVGVLRRTHSAAVLAERTTEMAPPTVNVSAPKLGASTTEFVLPGNVTAYTDAPIYANTAGYLKHWYFDIGARVKKGALLAEISAPELDQQLQQAEQDLAAAQATARNAQTQSARYSDLVKTNAVSQQDTDTFTNQAASTAATVRSVQANVQRLKDLQSYEKIYAPFEGVVTGRTVDIGQLISSGTATQIFHMQALETLRVYANVPQVYSQSVKQGMKLGLTFPEHPSKIYTGTLVRTASAIDPGSRTLLVEIDVNNRAGELMPGSMAQVHFKTSVVAQSYIVPMPAIIFRADGLSLGTVVKDAKGEDVARMVPITIGEDDGATVQIVSGIGPNDKVIQDPPDSLVDGERVTVVHPADAKPKANAKAIED